MTKKIKKPSIFATLSNSLTSLVDNFSRIPGTNGQPEISQSDTSYNNLRWYLISNNRQLLAQMYVELGIVRALVDLPVDDAFRTGFDIISSELDADNIKELMQYVEKNEVMAAVTDALKWTRLFGGGGLLISTDQDPSTPLDINALGDDSPLQFKDVDMWELFAEQQNIQGNPLPDPDSMSDGEFYSYYGHKIHRSRVLVLKGKRAPSFVRPRLRGWGVSVVECVIRPLNQYLKNQDVVFELLDEAKIDVYKIRGFNEALTTDGGTDGIAKRVQLANMIKNYNHAIIQDFEDEYLQKQMSFAGLSEVLQQIKQGIACDVRMPLTKLFGVSSAGFNSGEDDIENYNSVVEGEVRAKVKYIVVEILKICCIKVFGHVPEDLTIEFRPLRILGADAEEKVKDSQYNRTISAYQSGLIQSKETKEAINKNNLLPTTIDVDLEATAPLSETFTISQGETVK